MVGTQLDLIPDRKPAKWTMSGATRTIERLMREKMAAGMDPNCALFEARREGWALVENGQEDPPEREASRVASAEPPAEQTPAQVVASVKNDPRAFGEVPWVRPDDEIPF